MKVAFVALLVVVLTGCTGNPVRKHGGAVMDTLVREAEMVICNDASVGSIRRRYGVSEQMAEKWESFCSTIDVQIVE